MRFRKSIRVAKGVRLNLSKSGIGMSAGTKGFRVGVGPKGVYRSVGIPGTGLYSVDYVGSGKRSKKMPTAAAAASPLPAPKTLASQLFAEMPTTTQMGLSVPHTFGYWTTAIIVALLFKSSWGPYAGMGLIALWAIGLNREAVRLGKVYEQARAKVLSGRFLDALTLLEGLSGRVPQHLLILALGHCYYGVEDDARAIEHYLGYLEAVGSSDPAILIRCSSLLLRNARAPEALSLLERLPEQNRVEPFVIGMKGACLLEDGKPELAIEVLKTAPLRKRTPDPILTAIRYTLGQAYEASGQKKKAMAQFRRVYADDPTFQDIKDIVGENLPEGDAEQEPDDE